MALLRSICLGTSRGGLTSWRWLEWLNSVLMSEAWVFSAWHLPGLKCPQRWLYSCVRHLSWDVWHSELVTQASLSLSLWASSEHGSLRKYSSTFLRGASFPRENFLSGTAVPKGWTWNWLGITSARFYWLKLSLIQRG